MNKSMRITLSAALLALLAGCGAKGPLILPEKAVPIEAPTETAPETTPESIPPVDGTQTDAVPTEPKAGDTSETPAHPGEG
ncbi:MAG: LPS translocon maturation chaperone LptM [Pseudoxanthomonas sp.]